MYYRQVVEKRAVKEYTNEASKEAHSGSGCAICQRSAQDYYHHWACFKFFAICRSCYLNLHMAQCTTCKGVGSAADITQNRAFSATARICPPCREKLSGVKGRPAAVS